MRRVILGLAILLSLQVGLMASWQAEAEMPASPVGIEDVCP